MKPALQIGATFLAGDWPEGAETLAEQAAQAAWTAAQQDDARGGAAELSLVFADDGAIRGLNRDWRGKDAATNVLSFPADLPGLPEDAARPLGDVVLALETIGREAVEQQKPFPHHLAHMVVHGVLHLMGFDHLDDRQAERMEALETEILAGMSIPPPYPQQAER